MKMFFPNFIKKYLQTDDYTYKKIIYLSLSYFFIIAAYSILRPLKGSIFLSMVGKEYLPMAKMINVLAMIPFMFLYSKLIDKLKRHQTAYFFLLIYAFFVIGFTYFLIHPTIGLANTQTHPWRILGWIYEFAMDMFQALIVGTFWGFVNSISTPSFANTRYSFIVAFARIGGMASPAISWFILERTSLATNIAIPGLTAASALLLLCAFYYIYRLIKEIPEKELHGYEAAYEVEQKREISLKKPGVFEGLRLMVTEPYVLGIFGLVYSFEVINIIFDYQMEVLMSVELNNNLQQMSSFLFLYTGTFQALSFVFALLGTSKLLHVVGVQGCLIIMPAAVSLLALWFFFSPTLVSVFIIAVILRALNYGFNQPVREILYIPTVKDIQFKSKAWIDSFGRTFSKTSGSAINQYSITQSAQWCLMFESTVMFGISMVWLVIAYFVGRTHRRTISENKVIGNSNTSR
ncbi:MAG: Npt1/Npt2 family nucleotide transporter [Candidatus Babeliales bacterium]